ncbi:hypothetical protein [Parasitella parasitica]|uniref:Uncharacterized protein n=1 Tax=Parasitella parasitica TaxID=35722 RepID=A0A0B7N747_9FUNG|nr:hypothetical protein [Parasitella parasitica]
MEYGLSISQLLVSHSKAIEKAQDICLRVTFHGKATASTQVYKHMAALPHMHERIAIVSVIDWLDSSPYNQIKEVISRLRQHNLIMTLTQPAPPVLLSACRPHLRVDPIFLLPMDNWLRSRLCRWRMGWLPARPSPCRCGHPHASQNHLLSYLSIADRLKVPLDAKPKPLDYVLNQLLAIKRPPSSAAQHNRVYFRWASWWSQICSIMLEIDSIYQPDEEFSLAASDTQGMALLEWLLPIYFKPVAPAIRSTLYDYL